MTLEFRDDIPTVFYYDTGESYIISGGIVAHDPVASVQGMILALERKMIDIRSADLVA